MHACKHARVHARLQYPELVEGLAVPHVVPANSAQDSGSPPIYTAEIEAKSLERSLLEVFSLDTSKYGTSEGCTSFAFSKTLLQTECAISAFAIDSGDADAFVKAVVVVPALLPLDDAMNFVDDWSPRLPSACTSVMHTLLCIFQQHAEILANVDGLAVFFENLTTCV